ncbi:MAG: PAS domain S-box protein [Actinobacteria bacterium]|nr:PAS domain S-box protein [Actinomycetota bacterium]
MLSGRGSKPLPADGPSLSGSLPSGTSFRLRIVAYLVLFSLLPVGVAGWAIARQSSQSEIARVDASLNAMLRAALSQLEMTLGQAERRAETLAASQPVRRALRARDPGALRAHARRNPNSAFYVETALLGGRAPAPAALATSVEAITGERVLGRVVVSVPFDRALAAELRRASALAEGDELVLTSGGSIVQGVARGAGLRISGGDPTDVDVDGVSYRAMAASLGTGGTASQLIVLRPSKTIDAAGRDVAWRVLLGALAALGAIALLGYAGAPAIARGRLSQQQRAQAARVLEHVGDGVVLVDRGGVVRFWNAGAEAITGLAGEAVTGKKLNEVIPGWRTVAALIPVGTGTARLREPARAKTVPVEIDGTEFWLSLTGVKFAEGTVYTFRDLTEERRLDELKSDFVTTVSHEFRTPVAAVYGAAVILEERGDELEDEARAELLGIIFQQSDRLARLVNDILVAGQLASEGLELVGGAFDAAALARSVIDETPVRLRNGVPIDLHAPADVPLVAGDGAKARQVLANLLENAIKYSPDGGRIDVALEPHGRFLRFAVQDRGLGIPHRDHERVFEKFYRADPQMRRGIAGTGLGLYICRGLVRRMNGRMWMTSEPGSGSTFFFELPFVQTPAATEALTRL